MTEYEAVIGLETHIQLNTRAKIFCTCKADSWEDAPNTNICPVCTGLPGVLPVFNKEVVEKAVLLAEAMHAAVQPVSCFDRKNYFYPDLPKGYQISQFDMPLAKGDLLTCPFLLPLTPRARLHLPRAHQPAAYRRGCRQDQECRPAAAGGFQPLRCTAGGDGHRTRPAHRR